jgi:dolichol kinase
MPLKFHRGGRLRGWLGAKFGGDFELGDRIWRRCLHFAGAFVLLYYILPPRFFLVASNLEVLLIALAAVLLLELLRHVAGAELPTIRPYERKRIASYAFYATALVVAVLVFPRAIATVVVLGVSLVDPLIGELRVRKVKAPTNPGLPIAAYFALATASLTVGWHVPIPVAATSAALAAVVGVAIEAPRVRGVDDDLAMTLVPAIALLAVALTVPFFQPLLN